MAIILMANGMTFFGSIAILATALTVSAGSVDAATALPATPVAAPTSAKPDTKVSPKPDNKADTKLDTKSAASEETPAPPEAAKQTAAGDDPLSPEAQVGVRKYCTNIAAAASDARFAWQSKKLQELETKIKARLVELDARQAEVKRWYERREVVNKEAKESLVGIYSKMKPENAAAQISALDDEMAVAVLAALSPGKASAIFNEITPTDRAAKLAGLLANPSAPPAEKKL